MFFGFQKCFSRNFQFPRRDPRLHTDLGTVKLNFIIRRKQVSFDLLEKTEGMMRMEHAYANFEETGPDAAEYASDCGLGKRGLFVQFMRDSTVREDNGKMP